jgi:hypothetical protein
VQQVIHTYKSEHCTVFCKSPDSLGVPLLTPTIPACLPACLAGIARHKDAAHTHSPQTGIIALPAGPQAARDCYRRNKVIKQELVDQDGNVTKSHKMDKPKPEWHSKMQVYVGAFIKAVQPKENVTAFYAKYPPCDFVTAHEQVL